MIKTFARYRLEIKLVEQDIWIHRHTTTLNTKAGKQHLNIIIYNNRPHQHVFKYMKQTDNK